MWGGVICRDYSYGGPWAGVEITAKIRCWGNNCVLLTIIVACSADEGCLNKKTWRWNAISVCGVRVFMPVIGPIIPNALGN